MTPSSSPTPAFTKSFVRHGAFVYRPLQVMRRQDIRPRYVGITLAGSAVRDLYFQSPDDDVRVVVPMDLNAIPGDLQVVFEPEYKVTYPEDAPPYEVKAYTIRRFDPDLGELDLEIALHDKGHGDFWARNAQPGQTVLVAGAWGSWAFSGQMDHLVMIGDETALPAIGHMIEKQEMTRSITVVAEVRDGADELEWSIPVDLDCTIHWVHRGNQRPGRNTLLLEGVRKHIPLLDNTLYWGNGESSTMREIRRYLVDELGVHRKAILIGGYWKREDDESDWFFDEGE